MNGKMEQIYKTTCEKFVNVFLFFINERSVHSEVYLDINDTLIRARKGNSFTNNYRSLKDEKESLLCYE